MIGGNCITCRFYSKGSHYDCRENVDELVIDKERPNFCEFYQKDSKREEEYRASKEKKASLAEDAFNSFFSV